MDIRKQFQRFTILGDVRTVSIVILGGIMIYQAYQNQGLRTRINSMTGRTTPRKRMKVASMPLTDLRSSKDVNLAFPSTSVGLYFFLRKECEPCKASKPLVGVLAGHAHRRGIDPMVVYMDKAVSREEISSYLNGDANVFKIRSEIGEFIEHTKAYATPTVYLVDTAGTVRDVWIGMIHSSKCIAIDHAMDELVKGNAL